MPCSMVRYCFDACSKVIPVKNQVSLGTEEICVAKKEFETWLCETVRVSVK